MHQESQGPYGYQGSQADDDQDQVADNNCGSRPMSDQCFAQFKPKWCSHQNTALANDLDNSKKRCL